MKIVAVLVVLALVITLAVWSVMYMRYRSTALSHWASRVRIRWNDLTSRLKDLEYENTKKLNTDKLAKDLFNQHLKSLSVNETIEFPGIGPATVDRINAAGLRNIYDLIGYEFQRIPGFGPVKSKEMQSAVNQIVANAHSRFDAGSNAEGQEYRRQVAELEAKDRAEKDARSQTMKLIQSVMAQMKSQYDVASQVGFIQWVSDRHVPGLSDELMAKALLEVPRDVIVTIPRQSPAVIPTPPPVTKPVDQPVIAQRAPVPPPPIAKPASPPVAKPNDDIFWQSPANAGRESTVSEATSSGLARITTITRFGILFCKADGRIAKAERVVLRDYLGSKFGHDPALLRHIDPQIEQAESAKLDESSLFEQLKSSSTTLELKDYYQLAHDICEASGEHNAREADMLARLASAWKLDVAQESTQPTIAAPPVPGSLFDPRKVLEIEPGTELSVDLIRRRYNLLTEKSDPAKAAKLGPDFAAMAERKRADVRRAAEELIKPFNVPLDPPSEPPPPSDIRHNPDLDDVFGG